MKRILIAMIAVLFTVQLNAQTGVSISSTNADPDNSAMLDVQSTDKGMLIPRVALTGTSDATTIASPAISLMVYNTATANDVTPGFYYWNGTAWTTMTASSSSATHYVGELYGGGVVFWVDNTGDHGLICSMVDISTSQAWSDVTDATVPNGALSDWDGATNSTNIIAQSSATSAADICATYTNADYGTGTYSDWYLPSIYELNDLWSNIKAVTKTLDSDGDGTTTALARNYYWSSSERNATSAWQFTFNAGYAYSANRSDTDYVRGVRAF